MTNSHTQTDAEILAGLDFDYEVPCQSKHRAPENQNCSVKVRWRIVAPCCGCVRLACDGHRMYLVNIVRDYSCRNMRCTTCGAVTPKTEYERTMVIEPIKM